MGSVLGLAEVERVYEFRGGVAQSKLGMPGRLPRVGAAAELQMGKQLWQGKRRE